MPVSRTAGAIPNPYSAAAGASVAKGLLQQAEPALELLVRCSERRQEPDHVSVQAAREEEQPLLEGSRSRRLRRVGRRLAQLEREHRAEAAHLADDRTSGGNVLKSRSQERAELLGALAEAGRRQLVEHGESGRAGHGIAAERAAESSDVNSIHQLRAAGDSGERQAAAN